MKIALHPSGREFDRNTMRHTHFDSLYELDEWLTTGDGKRPLDVEGSHAKVTRNRSSENTPKPHWDLNTNFAEAKRMAFEGWPEGAAEVDAFSDKVQASWPHAEVSAMSEGVDFAMEDEGDELCIESYMDGSDRYWQTPVFHYQKPIVRIGVNIGALGSVSAQSMMARGVVCASVVQQIERLGFGVQLYVIHASCNSSAENHIAIRSIRVKDSDEYVHASTLAFWIAHPAAMRRISFRILEGSPFEPAKIGGNCGRTQECTSDDLDYITPSVHAMQSSGALQDDERMTKATIKMVEEILRTQEQVVDQFATS